MKLCFLASIESNHSRKWIQYFIDRGHEIHWISLPSVYIREVKGAKIYLIKDFSSKPLDIIFNTLSVRRLIRKINPDLLHTHYVGVNGALGAFSGFHPFLLTAYGSDILIAPKSKLVEPLVKFALKKADLITCDAQHMKEAIARLGANINKIKIIYFGIDTKQFSPGEKNQGLKNELGLGDSPVVISLRNLEPIYDVETLIRTAPFVLKEFPETKFIIAGDGSEKKKLKELADSLGVSKNVFFVGWIKEEEMPGCLRAADIYVSTSLSDAGIAASTAEAMACGLPVIITDFGDNKNWVKDGESGFLISLKNPRVLAEKIIYLIKNKNSRLKFGKAGRKIIEEKNNYYKEMEKMEEIYKELIKT